MSRSQHAKLVVYEKALDVVAALELAARTFPVEHRHLADQLRRASTSIPLNIAEGAAEFSPKEKARFYRIARRSAMECSSILDVLARVERGRPQEAAVLSQLDDVAAMITGMVRSVESRPR